MSTTATQPNAKSAVEEASPLTHQLFQHHMNAMAVHYKTVNSNGAGPSHLYALPIHLMHPVTASGNFAVPAPPAGAAEASLDAILNNSGTATKGFAKNQRDFVQQQTDKLQTTHDTAGFADRMNAQRQKAKQDSDKQIDDTYNKLIDLGTKHPELQPHILTAAQTIGAFFLNLLTSVGAFFTNIYNKIVGWINSAVDWIKGAAAVAEQWLSGAVSSIGNFFSSIF